MLEWIVTIGTISAAIFFFWKLTESLFYGMVISILFWLGLFLVLMCVTDELGERYTKKEYDISIESITKDQSLLNGRFYLGSGYINSSPAYFTMIKLGKNSFKPYSILNNDILSIDESNETPKIEVYKTYRSNKIVRFIVPIIEEYSVEDINYKIIVPIGTVICDYKVN